MYSLAYTLNWLAIILSFITFSNCEEAHTEDVNIFSITCNDKLNKIRKITSNSTVTVKCPFCGLSSCYLYGTGFYTPRSEICCAGVHDGKISNSGGVVIVNIHIERRGNFRGSTQHDVTSLDQFHKRGSYFTLTSVAKSIGENATTPVLTEITTPTVGSLVNGSGNNAPSVGTTARLSSLSSFINNKNSPTLPSQAASLLKGFEENDNKLSATKPDLKPNSSSANLHKDAVFPEESTSSSKVIILAVGIVAGIVVVAVFGMAAKYFSIFSRICGEGVLRSRRSQSNDCVCYFKMDSSNQSLLNDPDTCQRPCEVRELIEQAEGELDLACSNQFSSDCTECTQKCHSSNFVF